MSKEKFTDRSVANAKPPDGKDRDDIFDLGMPGLVLRVTAGRKDADGKEIPGKKNFVVRGRVRGQPSPIWVPLGTYPAMTLKAAHDAARDTINTMKRGVDPREATRRAKVEAEQANTLQWERVADLFIERYAKKNRSWRQTEALFKNHVTPQWKDRLLTEIERSDVVAVLDKVEDRFSLYQANRVLAAVRKLFNWAMNERGLVKTTPIGTGMARSGEEARIRFLSFDEIRDVWRAAGRIGYPFGSLLQLLLVTGQRRGEAANAKWAAFDTEHEKIWTLTPEDTKANREHLVPLSGFALKILEKLPRTNDPVSKKPVYLFTTTGGSPISGFSKAKATIDKELAKLLDSPLPEWRFHDLRRTVATHMEDALGIPPHIVGSVLNHAPAGYKGVTSVYTRGDLIYERRRALTAWARLLRLIVDDEGEALWAVVIKILRPETEADAGRTAEFRRMIQGEEETWTKYLKALTETPADNVVRITA